MKQRSSAHILQAVLARFLTAAMLLALLPVCTYAEEAAVGSTSLWASVSAAAITAEDIIAITITAADGTVYALPSTAGRAAAPAATACTRHEDGTLAIPGPASDYSWKFSLTDAGYAVRNNSGSWLYTISSNTGIRIGSTETYWRIDSSSGLLCARDTSGEVRYLGVYSGKPDWRGYASAATVLKGQTLGLWKLSAENSSQENSDPVNPDPVNPDPVNPDPATPDPVNPDPVNPDPVNPDPAAPDPVNPDPVNPDPVDPDPVNPTPEQPDTPNPTEHQADSTITDQIAAWSGSGPYADGALSIYGDCSADSDQLDSSAVFTALVNSSPVTPFTAAKGATGSVSYYLGGRGIGSGSNDCLQLEVSTAGWGSLSLSFRLRTSSTGAGAWQVQYSADGAAFAPLTDGSWEICGTDRSGTITDGIARTSLRSGSYISFCFPLPAEAENAQQLLIRLVPDSTRQSGGTEAAPGSSGTVRMDSVVLSGSPLIGTGITGYITTDADAAAVPGEAVSLQCATQGAQLLYRFAGSSQWLGCENGSVQLPDSLPACLETKAVCSGLQDSAIRRFVFTQATVSSVVFYPNGGSLSTADGPRQLTLSCDTPSAQIFFSTDGGVSYQPYTQGCAALLLQPGFGALTVQAYAAVAGFENSPLSTRSFTESSSSDYQLYFGQLHSHTAYSDGAGTAEEAFSHASGVENLDFLAITDHSNSFDHASDGVLSADAAAISEEWAEGKALSAQYTTDRFVALFGFEMTWANGIGHINTFNTPGFQSRTQAAYSSYSSALTNYYNTLKTVPDSISQFNHPGSSFGDFSDLAFYDAATDRQVTLLEVGNGEGAVGGSGYYASYAYYTMALDHGWHVAPTNNQDNHKGMWGDANTARSVVLSSSLTEDGIYDALRNYRVYATEDSDLSIYYRLNGSIMGSILPRSSVSDTVQLSVVLSDPTDSSIGLVEVITDGGRIAASAAAAGNDCTVEFSLSSEYSYYYIRIMEPDGDLAVTAPVWLESAGHETPETPDSPDTPETPDTPDQPEDPETPPVHLCPSAPYLDVKQSDWFHNAIDWAVENRILYGTSGTTMEPNTIMTRAMFVTMLYRMSGKPEVSGEMPFRDVSSGSYYYRAVLWASQNRIAYGTSSESFSPDEAVSREQLVTFLYRFGRYCGYDMEDSVTEERFSSFGDTAEVDQCYRKAMLWATARKIVSGYPDHTLRPNNGASRAECAQIFRVFTRLYGSDHSAA